MRSEYCETPEDFLARRTRLAFLDKRACEQALPRVRQHQRGLEARLAAGLFCVQGGCCAPRACGGEPLAVALEPCFADAFCRVLSPSPGRWWSSWLWRRAGAGAARPPSSGAPSPSSKPLTRCPPPDERPLEALQPGSPSCMHLPPPSLYSQLLRHVPSPNLPAIPHPPLHPISPAPPVTAAGAPSTRPALPSWAGKESSS